MKMKKIYYLSMLGLVALAGCQKEPIDRPGTGEGDAMVFNASIDGLSLEQSDVQSRAVVDMKDTDFDQYGFDIAGYYTVGGFDTKKTTAYPNVFDHDPKDGQIPVPRVLKGKVVADKFALKTVKWALTDNGRLSFFAWGQNAHRKGEGGTSTGITNYIGKDPDVELTKGYPWITVDQNGTPANQVDVVGARVMDEKNDAVISAVDLEFHHLFAKATFKAKSSNGVKMTFTGLSISYASGKVLSVGKYVFGNSADALGRWTDLSAPCGTSARTLGTGSAALIAGGGETTLGDMLVMPQPLAKGDISINITYQVEIAPGVMSQTITRKLPVPAITYVENTNHVLTLDFIDNDQVVFNTSIAPWTEVTHNTLPYVPGPRDPEVLIELDGSDAPYYDIATGKSYWLDRSGWNRHAEIVGGVTHNPALKCYTSPGGQTNWLKLPALPNAADGRDVLSADVISQGIADGINTANIFSLSNQNYDYSGIPRDQSRQFSIHISNLKQSTVFLDTRGTSTNGEGRHRLEGTSMTPTQDLAAMNALAFWSFSADNAANSYRTKIIYNGSQVYETTHTVTDPTQSYRTLQDLQYNKVLHDFKGNVYYFKVMRKIRTNGEVLGDYINIYRKFGIPDTNTDLPPVKEGLVLCFDSRDVPNTTLVPGKTVWPDRGPYENHAVWENASAVLHQKNENGIYYYVVGAGTGRYATLLKDMPYEMNSLTVELILKVKGAAQGSPIGFISVKGNGVPARFSFHMPYQNNTTYIDIPLEAGTYRFSFDTDNTIFTAKPASFSAVRDQDGMVGPVQLGFYRNNSLVKSNKLMKSSLGIMTGGVIGAARETDNTLSMTSQQFDIYAIRIYDRPLSEAERQQNYEFDKAIYGIE